MYSSSDEEVIELEWPTKKQKFSFSHTQDRWHFVHKDEQASIIRQQKPSGTRFSGSSANCSFLAFFNNVKLAIARFVEDTVIFGTCVLLGAPS